jgi:hypothetical protein
LTNHHAEQSTGGVVFNTKHVVMLIIICKKPATKESSTKNKMNDNKYVARNYRKEADFAKSHATAATYIHSH